MEELYPGNKEILSVTGIFVQAQERYPTRIIDMPAVINHDAKTPGHIANF